MFLNTSEGSGVWGRGRWGGWGGRLGITVSGVRWSIHGQSCLAPGHSTMVEAKPSGGRGGPGSAWVWIHWRVFKASRLPEHTEFLRGRAAEPGSPWERLTQGSGPEAELNRTLAERKTRLTKTTLQGTGTRMGGGQGGCVWHRENWHWNTCDTDRRLIWSGCEMPGA